MPICSILSVACLIPAVSMNLNVIPLMSIVSSIVSRVVPCMSDTMARSSFSSLFSSVDLPTLVFPMMATGMPFFIACPVSKEWASFCMCLSISSAMVSSSFLSANSSSSWSAKSSSSSRSDVSLSSFSLSCDSCEENCHRSWLIAMWCVALFVAAIRSATASACERSIFPFRYALFVNSPGSAGRAP